MRILVISDTHGSLRAVEAALAAGKPDAAIFLGDGESEFKAATEHIYDIPVLRVRGNCDYDYSLPVAATVEFEGVRLLITHGHAFGVNAGIGALLSAAAESCCKIALFGHTHRRFCEQNNGIYLFNPGSAKLPRDGYPASAGVVTLQNGKPPAFSYIEL